jgi:hypothetical protein
MSGSGSPLSKAICELPQMRILSSRHLPSLEVGHRSLWTNVYKAYIRRPTAVPLEPPNPWVFFCESMENNYDVTVGRVNTARLLDMCGNHG